MLHNIDATVCQPLTELGESFKAAMGNAAAPVSVVTVLDGDQPFGTTVSAFMSLSITPPMLIVSLDNNSILLSRIDVGSIVGVNILDAGHPDLALNFATKRDNKFEGVDWRIENGAPALSHRHAWVSMSAVRLVEGGDHTLVLGEVVSASTFTNVPLTYWQSTFGTHRPCEPVGKFR